MPISFFDGTFFSQIWVGGGLWQLLHPVIQCPSPLDKTWYFSLFIIQVLTFTLIWPFRSDPILTNPRDEWNMVFRTEE